MLDLKYVCENIEEVEKRLSARGGGLSLAPLIGMNRQRKEVITLHDNLRHEQRNLSSIFKEKGADKAELENLRGRLKAISEEIAELAERQREIEKNIEDFLLYVPNIPHQTVPPGASSEDNMELRKIGEPPDFSFKPLEHFEIGERLGILDFETAGKISGSRFVLYKGDGARLERALTNFMLDIHTELHGYTEVLPPFLVNENSMIGTGQLPKFAEEAFKTDGFYLIPTAEVPVTNMFRDVIFEAEELPRKFCAYSACFRREAGSHGKDVRGMTRVHQFQKVELVKFVRPENSYDEHESLAMDAEEVLKRLNLHYRVVSLCTGDLGFSAARCYDIEVWLPGQNTYREISSCSNFEDFQARRINARFRPARGEKPRYVHTLNGSGLAIGRTIIAILENYQLPDGGVEIPNALRPYMGNKSVIEPVV